MSSSYPTTCFLSFFFFFFVIPFSLYIPVPFFSDSYYSSHIFSPPCLRKRWKNTSKGGNNSFLASWNSFNHFSAVLEDHVYYILLHETMPLREYVLKERYYTQIIMTRCFRGMKILRFSLEWKASLANISAEKEYRKLRNTFVEICSRCVGKIYFLLLLSKILKLNEDFWK